jgi:hypothetical protein
MGRGSYVAAVMAVGSDDERLEATYGRYAVRVCVFGCTCLAAPARTRKAAMGSPPHSVNVRTYVTQEGPVDGEWGGAEVHTYVRAYVCTGVRTYVGSY